MTHTIPFNVPTTEPEAFSEEWARWNAEVEESIGREEPSETPERTLNDIVREHDENQYELDDIERLSEEWDKHWSRFDYPYEFE